MTLISKIMKNKIVKAVLFDFDGTLTHPGALDFARIKQAVGCPPDQPVLEYIEAMSDPAARTLAHGMLEDFEMAAAGASEPNAGAEALVRWCRQPGTAFRHPHPEPSGLRSCGPFGISAPSPRRISS